MKRGAFNLIFNEDREILLCLRNDRDIWNLPGGIVEPGESPWEAAIREAREEINVDVEIKNLQGLFYKPNSDEVVFQFFSKIISGEPSLSDEAKEIKYFSVDKLPYNIAPLQCERIKLYYQNPEQIFMHIHR